jgi:hypothetical protein
MVKVGAIITQFALSNAGDDEKERGVLALIQRPVFELELQHAFKFARVVAD